MLLCCSQRSDDTIICNVSFLVALEDANNDTEINNDAAIAAIPVSKMEDKGAAIVIKPSASS